MRLEAGTRLGPYEIVSPIGAGGMGVVYRGRDTRLGRDVAIKVLPPESSDQASRDRFEREARAVAALTHPHICAIHDVGSDGVHDFLVLELIEGESLAARLKRGPLRLDEAVTWASQMAAAVGHAHRAGIVHRDLKPANIMLTRAGVKVLDFGLARIIQGEHAAAGSTVTAMMQTSPGTIMGTLPYMAPEQIEGRTVDARADVFAFGAVLYEMLTAKRAFDAPSGPALMASILRDQSPSVRTSDASLPAAVDRVIHACLAKSPDDRFGDINDAAVALRWAGEDARRGPSTNSVPGSQPMTRRAAIAGGVALLGGAAGYLLGARRPPVAVEAHTVDVRLPQGYRNGPGLALSPDGRWLAASFNPDQALWLYDLQTGEWARPGNVVTNALYPFWSPDGKELGYFSADVTSPDAKLWRVAPPDGVPVPICDFSGVGAKGGAWLQDNSIVLAAGLTPLFKVDAGGGVPREFIPLAAGEQSLRFPMSTGTHVIYLAQRPGQRSELRQVSSDGARRTVIAAPSQEIAVSDRGYLFFSRHGVVMGQRYAADLGTLSGEPSRVPHDSIAGAMNVGHLQVAAGGGHVAVLNEHRARRQLVWRDRAGARIADVAGLADAQAGVDLSLDGQRAAVSRGAAEHSGSQLWIIDLESGAERRLMTSEFDDWMPLWSADSSRLLFRSNRGATGNGNLYSVNVDGPPATTTMDEGGFSMYPGGWSGQSVVWASDSASRTGDAGIWITSGGQRRQLIRAIVTQARLSPDGTRIAYSSAPSGRPEVYVDAFPVAGPAPVRVSRSGGTYPRWRADGRELYFLEGTALMASTISSSSALVTSVPARLFTIANDGLVAGPYAPAGDGSRFLVIEDRIPKAYSVKLTLNWQA